MLTSFVGAVSTCLTGPTNALLADSGERSRHYVAVISCGLFAVVFGLFAPLFTQWMLGAPGAFIAVLGGLAMLRVLQNSFLTTPRLEGRGLLSGSRPVVPASLPIAEGKILAV